MTFVYQLELPEPSLPTDLVRLETFPRDRFRPPSFCACCCKVHTDQDINGELFELCLSCQAELTAFSFE